MVTHPNIVSWVWGAQGSLDATHAQWAQDITIMYMGLLSSVDFMDPFNEYPGPPPNAGTIEAFTPTCQGPGYVTLSNRNSVITAAEVKTELEHQVALGLPELPPPSSLPGGQVIYLTFLPPTIRQSDVSLCWATFGYHMYDAFLKAIVTVVPICNGNYPDGTPGVVSTESGTEYAAAHEMMEAMTDPGEPGFLDGWHTNGLTAEGRGPEIGDLCAVAATAQISVFTNQPPYTVPLFFSNKAYRAFPSDSAQPVTGARGCVAYPSSCQICFGACPGGCFAGNPSVCTPGCSCSLGCTVGRTPCGGGVCTAATACQTIADNCGNPVVCPCNVPAAPPWSVAFLSLSLGGLGAVVAVRLRRRAAWDKARWVGGTVSHPI
jgi:hypothetical protein